MSIDVLHQRLRATMVTGLRLTGNQLRHMVGDGVAVNDILAANGLQPHFVGASTSRRQCRLLAGG